MELGDLVPLCTALAGTRDLHLRSAGIDVLEGARHESRKVALVAVLQPEPVAPNAEQADEDAPQRGIYISSKSVSMHEQDGAVLFCTLRLVDLQQEPFWGSLLLLLSSHVFVATTGALTPAQFASMGFLTDFLSWTVLDTEAPRDEDNNTTLLRAFLPKLTWVALDLKIKEMEGQETATRYLEYKLSNPPMHGDPAELDAQMLVAEFFADRDCLVLKSNSLSTPPGCPGPQAITSSKLVAHALEMLQVKPIFGRYLSGGLVLHLLRSLAHSVSSDQEMVLQRVVQNVYLSFWRLLLESAYEKYTDMMHARIAVYEKIEINAEYLVDVTERKMQNQHMAVVNAGQGQFSVFDEFGNLKRQSSVMPAKGAASNGGDATLNTDIFTFLKNRAGRAFSKQFSGLSLSSSSSSSTAGGTGGGDGLGHIAEDEEEVDGQVAIVSSLSADDLLAQYNAPITRYEIPMEYASTKAESMPLDVPVLDRIHREALDDAKSIILPFLYALRASEVTYSELRSTLDFHIGKRNLFDRVRRVKKRFTLANEAASTMFCAQLVQYLHSIVLRKSETDNAAQQALPRFNRATSSVMLPDNHDPRAPVGEKAAPLTKLPIELLTYKSNLEAMISQYNFLARGGMTARVLLSFFQSVVRKRLFELAKKDYSRFADACESKENRLADLEESLEETQQAVTRHERGNSEFSRQEAKAVADLDVVNKSQLVTIENAIQDMDAQIQAALNDQQALYQSTMQATRKTINTIGQVSEKSRVFMGYLERYEKSRVFMKSWRQYFYVLDHATLTCFKSKSAFEERHGPMEPATTLTGYRVVKSRTDEMKIKLIPPEAGQMLRFRAPASVGRETWMKKFEEASQFSGKPSSHRSR